MVASVQGHRTVVILKAEVRQIAGWNWTQEDVASEQGHRPVAILKVEVRWIAGWTEEDNGL